MVCFVHASEVKLRASDTDVAGAFAFPCSVMIYMFDVLGCFGFQCVVLGCFGFQFL
jgi:hypothetical protein